MDSWCRQHIDKDYDKDGQWATGGSCNKTLLGILMDDPYFALAPPKSTGKDGINLQWLRQRLDALNINIAVADVQRTLLELTAQSISQAIDRHGQDTGEVLVCGGGIHNSPLMGRLKELMPDMDIVSTAKYGIHPDAVEAVAFAWLAKCRLDRVPGNLPSVTGAERPVVLGAIYEA
jgi:anhydro-N-acetylmuramic acid kinase